MGTDASYSKDVNAFIDSSPISSTMGELETIAEELGNWVDYHKKNSLETLTYRDSNSMIIARNDVNGTYANLLVYQVESTKLESYLLELKSLKSELSQEIVKTLKDRKPSPIKDGSKHFLGDNFKLDDLYDAADIMKLHRKIYSG